MVEGEVSLEVRRFCRSLKKLDSSVKEKMTIRGEIYLSKLQGSSIAGGTPTRGRVEFDFYATPHDSTRKILNVVDLKGSILEPACGQGHISKVLKEFYPESEIVSTDIVDRGFGQGSVDFLNHDYKRTFTNVITNPPFKEMKEFTEKALELATDKVLMFGKIQFLEGKGRKEFLEKSPLKYVYVFSERQNPLRNGSPVDENGKPWSSTMCFAWYVWEKGYKGEPQIKWI
jgi:predicted RNA methylase